MSGRTHYPPFLDRPLPDKFGAGMSWMSRYPATGTFEHSMVGWLWSTDTYFRFWTTQAATDWGIGGQGDGDQDGVIIRWIDHKKRRNAAGWASGYDNDFDFDTNGAAYIQKFGHRAMNGGGRSIELSGLVNTPVTSKQWRSMIHLTAAIHHDPEELNQGYEEFAWNMHHRDVAEKDCPFPRVYTYTQEYQAAIVLVMKSYETGADIPETVMIGNTKVWLPTGETTAGVVTPPAAPLFQAFAQTIPFTTRPGARSRQWGSTESLVVRSYPTDTTLRIAGFYDGQEVSGRNEWLVIKSPGPSGNARIHISGVREELPAVFLDQAA